ncbi:MAG: hypothetical protein ABI551_15385, partial [Polyangiaceae bacterium]
MSPAAPSTEALASKKKGDASSFFGAGGELGGGSLVFVGGAGGDGGGAAGDAGDVGVETEGVVSTDVGGGCAGFAIAASGSII